jgi:hypothetical protein
MTMLNVPRIDLLPNAALTSGGAVAHALRMRGCSHLRSAADFIWKLPYGRNQYPEDPLCVLAEARGTCSTKHALLARLLEEERTSGFELRVGIYAMTDANTPGVGRVLAQHGLRSIPEAHCCLVAGGVRLDVTRVLTQEVEPIGAFMAERTIRPDQIGADKRAFHHQFLAQFAATHPELRRTAEELWRIREACIAALAAVGTR